MEELKPGFVFETVFWATKSDSGTSRLIAQNLNGEALNKPILCGDRRILPGKRVRVKVESVTLEAIEVQFLGLVNFELRDSVYIDPALRKQFEILLCSGRSILLEGPQGTGKTTLSRELAHSLGMEYVFFNCSVCFEPADFVGSLQLLVDDEGRTRTDWIPTEVLRAVEAANDQPLNRYLIFLDELNRCRSFALNGIMSAIDSSRRIFDPRRNLYLPIPDNVQWIGAVNSGKQFTGTYKLDLAQLDRFAVLKIHYPPEDHEIRILQKRYDMVHRRHIRRIVRIANLIRAHEDIQTDLSMRATDEACVFLSYPTFQRHVSPDDLTAVLRTSFCNRLPGSIDERESEAGIAAQIINKFVQLNEAAHDAAVEEAEAAEPQS